MQYSEKVWISLPSSIHNHYGLQILSAERQKVQSFIRVMRTSIPSTHPLRPFWQGGHESNSQWAYFEFWGDVIGDLQTELMGIAERISTEVDLPLEIFPG